MLPYWCINGRFDSDRNHWSLFPVVFEGRCLPVDVYDELMGILVHGCIGKPLDSRLLVFTTTPIIHPPDIMTSSSSTLPYDDEKMRNMIGLVQKAKGTPVL